MNSKKLLLLAALFLMLLACIILGGGFTADNARYLRIHIRANSNEECDQDVKYIVKNQVVRYLTPFLAEARTKEEALSVVRQRLGGIEEVCQKTLKEKGYTYGVKANVSSENFPSRSYGGRTLSAGVYDSLIIYLGEGEGDNWWCVVYPPLCFIGKEDAGVQGFYYISKLKEIIDNFYNLGD
jgi:stage II sporulation protein R